MDAGTAAHAVSAIEAEVDEVLRRVTGPDRAGTRFAASRPAFVAALDPQALVALNLGSPEQHLGTVLAASLRHDPARLRDHAVDYLRIRAVSRVAVPPFGGGVGLTDPLLGFAADDEAMIRYDAARSTPIDAGSWTGDPDVPILQNLVHAVLVGEAPARDLPAENLPRATAALVQALQAILREDAPAFHDGIRAFRSHARRSRWIRDRYKGLSDVPILTLGLCAAALRRGLPLPDEVLSPGERTYLEGLRTPLPPPRPRAYIGGAAVLNPLVTDPGIELPALRQRLADAWAREPR
ncbi:hypothetical protein [Microbacterium resistens]|uniref:hypothetical protein n=1 Tax=Microbacterium resistens TaxID=156977 RepID=UPI003670ABA0